MKKAYAFELEPHTVVQHSAFGYARNPGFTQGLETRALAKSEVEKVRRAGGLVFEGPTAYNDAETYAEREMYPGDVGIYPRAPGRFARLKIDELAVYIPVTRPVAEGVTA